MGWQVRHLSLNAKLNGQGVVESLEPLGLPARAPSHAWVFFPATREITE